jgi:formylglycine-generating enzyme required for sulfatase activity
MHPLPTRYEMPKQTLISLTLIVAMLAVFAAPVLAVNNGDTPVNTAASARRMIEDLTKTHGAKYKGGKDFAARLTAIEAKLKANAGDKDAKAALATLIKEASLANPLLDFDKLVVIRRTKEANRNLNAYTSDTIRRTGWDNDIAELSNLRGEVKARQIYQHPNKSVMKHMDLHFSAQKVMFSGVGANGRWAILEVDANGKNLKELTPSDQKDVQWFDGCYLPAEGQIVGCSTAGMQGLPCVNGGQPMVNLYKVNTKTGNIRQLTFEQDSDWHPRVHHNGRVIYLRWEYTDTPHYFSRYMFHMNPDGTGQMELWGSGSYFPTAYCWARPVPNHPSMLVGTVSGHHAKSETGRLMLVNPALGRKYPFRHDPKAKTWGKEKSSINIHPKVFPASKTGCVQEIPGWGKDVVGNVYDNQGGGQKYTFGTPYPLSDKYFLVSLKGFTPGGKWTLCLVDVFDNMTTVYSDKKYSIFEPMPFVPRKTPPVIADRTIKGAPVSVFCTDVYGGRGLKGIPRGKVKSLRVFAYHYGYMRSGGHESVGLESSWDIKRILGTVPVEEDGSFSFNAPSDTPMAIQPLDENGAALALMRSWMVGMPGERMACNGCHEDLNEATPAKRTKAAMRPPSKITPWYGPTRPFAYQTEIQPMLNKYCVGCHNEKNKATKGVMSLEKGASDWRKDKSYLNLVAFTRHPGAESDLDMYGAMEWHASTSPLIQMFKKGHNNVKLDKESWQRLYTWIDLNSPHRGMWNNSKGEKRRLDLAKLYAGLGDNPEEEHRQTLAALKKDIKPVMPEAMPKVKPDGLKASGFPFDAAAAKKLQGDAAPVELTLAEGVTMKLVKIPAGQFVMGSQAGYADEAPRATTKIDKAFYMGQCEVTNKQFAAFDAEHDTRYLDENGKDHAVPGYIANHKDQPVARISWQKAMAFCKWLSKKTGKKVTLPTEAQWEWAARGGSDKQFFYGDDDTDFSKYANLADAGRLRTYVRWDGGSKIHKRNNFPKDYLYPLRDDRFTDKWFVVDYVKQNEANPFGLYDIVGNVCEWTRSSYKPYPYKDTDGRNDGKLTDKKVARGGSWADRPKTAGSTVRMPYESYQTVYNVGFRVIIE